MEEFTDLELLYLSNLVNIQMYNPILFTRDKEEENHLKNLKRKLLNIINERKS